MTIINGENGNNILYLDVNVLGCHMYDGDEINKYSVTGSTIQIDLKNGQRHVFYNCSMRVVFRPRE